LLIQVLGLTETATGVTATSELDISFGSSGSLLPGVRAKIVDAAGKEVTEYETPGELLVQSPSVALGYLNNEQATAETFVFHSDGRWMKTGDEALVRKSTEGNEHFLIIDRIKELIKVKVRLLALLAFLKTDPSLL
jgi:long-subunit acyl-CoA synthetase (AMP-forming)